MNPAKAIYHKFIPGSVRSPIGMARRRGLEQLRRLIHPGPLPHPALLAAVHGSPLASEFIGVGDRSAAAIRAAIAGSLPVDAKVLDFRCGCGRTMMPLGRSTRWSLTGFDERREAADWLASAKPGARVLSAPLEPPLPFGHGTFDAVYAVSVVTHFSREEHRAWSAELARILSRDGLLVLSTMGPRARSAFPPAAAPSAADAFRDGGYCFQDDARSFEHRLAFHSAEGIARLMSPEFSLWQHVERGLDGFQDLVVLVRR